MGWRVLSSEQVGRLCRLEQILGTGTLADDDDTVLAHREASSTILFVIETNLGSRWNGNAFVDNRATNSSVSTDIDAIEQN